MAFEAEYFQTGKTIDYTPSSAVAAGDVVILGKLVSVALRPIVANKLGALAVEGVFKFAKDNATAFAVGVLVYWDDTANEATETSAGNTLIGKTVIAAADTDTILIAKLNQ